MIDTGTIAMLDRAPGLFPYPTPRWGEAVRIVARGCGCEQPFRGDPRDVPGRRSDTSESEDMMLRFHPPADGNGEPFTQVQVTYRLTVEDLVAILCAAVEDTDVSVDALVSADAVRDVVERRLRSIDGGRVEGGVEAPDPDIEATVRLALARLVPKARALDLIRPSSAAHDRPDEQTSPLS